MMVDITGTDIEPGDMARLSVNPLLIQPFVERLILPIACQPSIEQIEQEQLLYAASLPEGETEKEEISSPAE